LATSIERLPNVTSVMGSPGAPGVSTLANFLGLILECTVVCSSHQNLRPFGNVIVKNISPENIIPILKDNSNDQILVDAGSSINLTSTLSDRRVGARWLREVVESSSQLIYVVKSNTQGINYLTEFIKDFSNLINPPSITVILNQQRFDRSSQEIQSSFKELMSGYSNFVLPFTSRIEVDSSSKQGKSSIWGMNSFQKQLAKIAAQVGKKKLYH
jgi:MinD-like ATPase involved in chromosome partitioning or flagellar assembly